MHSSPEVVKADFRHFTPRIYQTEIFDVALRQNTIAVLDTGSGKTIIAVMLLENAAHVLKSSSENKIAIFLAPTVYVVNQQCNLIRIHTKLKVGEYYGAMGIDDWGLSHWTKEISNRNVMVMTPQVCLDALRKAFLSIDMIYLLIFDECHHSIGNHPYAKILSEFYHKSKSKPKIFGMTASPVIRKGVSGMVDCVNQISQLESILDSQIYTIKDRTELRNFIPSAKEAVKFYESMSFSYIELKENLESSLKKFEGLFFKLIQSMPCHYKDVDDKIATLKKRLSSDHYKILHCLDELGAVCAYEAVKICLDNVPKIVEEYAFFGKCFLHYKQFLEDHLLRIGQYLSEGNKEDQEIQYDDQKAVQIGFVSPKLHELINILSLFCRSAEVLCLIFVERIITARVIERFVKRITRLSHLNVSFLSGSTSASSSLAPKMKETIKLFRSGKVNLLFTTDVVEEGIHVPSCSCVIRFNLPKTVRSYVQSRGRARQNNSQYLLMLERGNKKHVNHMFDIIRSEYTMTDAAISKDHVTCFVKEHTVKEVDAHVVVSTGASVTIHSSVNLIHLYCAKLPGDRYFNPKPIFQISMSEDMYVCKLTLPPSAAFQTLVGPSCKNSQLSKQLVCLEGCKKLHELGVLNDHLQPTVNEPSDGISAIECNESDPGAGTTKRKELHGTVPILPFTGTWGCKLSGERFYMYKMAFDCNIVDQFYSGFALLLESKLEDDVSNFEVELYLLSNKVVKASITSCGEKHLSTEQVKKAMCFQEFFFNAVFGKLLIGSRSSGIRKFLLNEDAMQLWDSSNMYLLLPLELGESNNLQLNIDWNGVSSCSSVVSLLKNRFLVGQKKDNDTATNGFPSSTEVAMERCKIAGFVHLANDVVSINILVNKVVVAVHTGKIYSVIDVAIGSSAESPFDRNTVSDISNKFTFSQYFKGKYGIVLKYPGQPLLVLKHTHNPHNLLVDFKSRGASQSITRLPAEKPLNHVHIPPELLVIVDVHNSVLKSLYLLPSLMYRLESLVLANQLRKEIDFKENNFFITNQLILEALTTVRCSEDFSMERLELLGDSVLKYVVTCYLFLTFPQKNEGQLSVIRQMKVQNSTLHNLGTSRNLQGYIRDSAFEPRRWVAPGQRSLHPVPCKCGVDTREVPLDRRFKSDDPNIVIGKACDRGHRWIISKTISDCVEALVGSYFVEGGIMAAVSVLKWFGLDIQYDHNLVEDAIRAASLRMYSPKLEEITTIETNIGYRFNVKGILMEAITHASAQELGINYSYQRLEYLGDSVLDLLVTKYLYNNHKNIDPGELTDLRSASVNNDSFANAAIRNNLHRHIQHCSGLLLNQVTEYVESFSLKIGNISSLMNKAPKVLGDILESIAGAVFIDSRLNLNEVWRIFEPLLSPFVTPESLLLPPVRKLNELCASLGYFTKETLKNEGEIVHAEISLQLIDALLIGKGSGKSKKDAKALAAHHLLEDLKIRGISQSREEKTDVNFTSSSEFDTSYILKNRVESTDLRPQKKQKITEHRLPEEYCLINSANNVDTKPVAHINMDKGGPRTSLYSLCRKQQWPMPRFTPSRKISRLSNYDDDDGRGGGGDGDEEVKKGQVGFVSLISLDIPNHGTVECHGGHRVDKKSSMDSAALNLLNNLAKMGLIVFKNL